MTEQEIRAAHPDWTDEQVTAELAKQSNPDPPKPDPTPSPPDDAAFARMRREKEEAERRAKAAEDKLAEEARKKAEEEGRWQELAEEEKRKREGLEAEKTAAEHRRLAERSASDLKFRDTGYALYLLEQDRVALSDPSAVKTALEALAANRKDLITGSAPPPSGGPAGGSNGDPPKLSADDLRKMTAQQISALDPKVVREALAG